MIAGKLGAAACICLLAACQSIDLDEQAPARFSSTPPSACLAQLTRFASDASKRPVTLNEQAFAQSDKLLLERPQVRGPDGRLLDGRGMDRPEVFRLVHNAGTCSVIHENSGSHAELEDCTCQGTNSTPPKP